MDAARLNERIMIQKNNLTTDEIGNHKNTWEDFISCRATIGGERATEKQAAGLTVDDAAMSVTVRYCRKTADVNALEYRILFKGEIYNITNVDHLNYRKRALKISCVKTRR